MPLIAFFQDSKRTGECRSCHAPIVWVKTIHGKFMPFDGEIVVVRTEGSPLTGAVIEYADTSITKTHFETCAHAANWRRR